MSSQNQNEGSLEDELRKLREQGSLEDKIRKLKKEAINSSGEISQEEDLFGIMPLAEDKTVELVTEPKEEYSIAELQKRIDNNDAYGGLEPFCESYIAKCNDYGKDAMSISYVMSKPEVMAKFGIKASDVKDRAEEYRKKYTSVRDGFIKINEEVEEYAQHLPCVLTEFQAEAEKEYYKKKAEECIALALKLDKLNSEKDKWLTKVVNQDWGISFEKEISLYQFLNKIEECENK